MSNTSRVDRPREEFDSNPPSICVVDLRLVIMIQFTRLRPCCFASGRGRAGGARSNNLFSPLFRLITCLCLVLLPSVSSAAMTVEELKAQIVRVSGKLKDLSFSVTVIEKNQAALEKMEPEYAALYELKSVRVYLKHPGMVRTEGKLGMVKFEYIINGWRKIVRAPMLKIRKESDYSGKPGKLTTPFDFGLVTPSLWDNRTVSIEDDPEASAAGEIRIRLRWAGSGTSIVAWLDAKSLCLKRVERRDDEDHAKFRILYLNHRLHDGVVWVPARAEMYAPDGARVGVSELGDVKVNTGLSDSLFK